MTERVRANEQVYPFGRPTVWYDAARDMSGQPPAGAVYQGRIQYQEAIAVLSGGQTQWSVL